MSTDRELLELAAKAAGFEVCQVLGVGSYFHCLMVWKDRGEGAFGMSWNPLFDSGDALELASHLGMKVYANRESLRADVECVRGSRNFYAQVNFDEDRHAAMRLAIVMTAARIGKDMP